MGNTDHEVVTTTLLSLLSVVVVAGLVLTFFILRRRHQKAAQIFHQGHFNSGQARNRADAKKLGLKQSTSWLAIRTRNLRAVQAALTLHNPQPCPCSEGLAGENEQKLFISPPISGWVLVVGPALPDPSEDVDACFRFLLELSNKLGHVQFFKYHPVLNHHAWAQVESGRIVRGYAWAGKTLWNQGETTTGERELKMKCYEYAEGAAVPYFWSVDPNASNAEKVHLLAASWSVDPENIDERLTEQAWGIAGEPARPI